MILFITNAYKENREDYANGFVHTRALAYKDHGYELEVFKPDIKKGLRSYTIDGIKVTAGRAQDLRAIIEYNTIDAICVHFIGPYAIQPLEGIDKTQNIFVFVHGNEVLHWYERIFKGTIVDLHSFLAFSKYALHNIKNMRVIRRFLKSTHHNVKLISVSRWMVDIGKKNWRTKDEWTLIPNYINQVIYAFAQKIPEDRFHFLSIRPYTSGKYANDITVKFILALQSHPDFGKMKFTIIGKGPLWERTIAPLKQFRNVTLINRFLNSDEIREYHNKNGFMICPTRQDAQGVSMCEAMSSGLIPLALNNTAIPEFLPRIEGIVCNDINDMYNFAAKLIKDEALFLETSRKCSQYISEKCGYGATIEREISMVTSHDWSDKRENE